MWGPSWKLLAKTPNKVSWKLSPTRAGTPLLMDRMEAETGPLFSLILFLYMVCTYICMYVSIYIYTHK